MASPNDLFRKIANNFSTTLDSAMAPTDTSGQLDSITGLPLDTGIDLVIDRVDQNGTKTPAKREYVRGIVAGNTVTGLIRGLGNSTALPHSVGAVVELVWTADTFNDLINALLVSHGQDGTIKDGAVSATSKIADGIISSSKIAPGAVTPANVAAANTTASTATITPAATSRGYAVTALAVNASIAAPTGTANELQPLTIRIKDAGSACTLTWATVYRPIGVTIPTTTVAGKNLYVSCIYNVVDATWDVVGVARQS